VYGTYCRLSVHVSASAREVIRAARTKLSRKGKSREQRAARHQFIRQMLDYHRDAQETFRAFRF
jgi:hypothetical protein